MLAMLASQILALSDVFYNYSYKTQAFLLALPNICTFTFIAYAIMNL